MKTKYINEIQPKLVGEFGLSNQLAVPRLEKIIVHVSLGEAKENAEILDHVKGYLLALSGQLPQTTHAKKSIAAFKVSKGQPIGMMVTLRGEKMYAFLDKLINVVLPKVRDFKGIAESSFDGNSSLNIGLKEQTIFPEVDYKIIDKVRGLVATIVTTAKDKQQAKKLLECLGVPLKKG